MLDIELIKKTRKFYKEVAKLPDDGFGKMIYGIPLDLNYNLTKEMSLSYFSNRNKIDISFISVDGSSFLVINYKGNKKNVSFWNLSSESVVFINEIFDFKKISDTYALLKEYKEDGLFFESEEEIGLQRVVEGFNFYRCAPSENI